MNYCMLGEFDPTSPPPYAWRVMFHPTHAVFSHHLTNQTCIKHGYEWTWLVWMVWASPLLSIKSAELGSCCLWMTMGPKTGDMFAALASASMTFFKGSDASFKNIPGWWFQPHWKYESNWKSSPTRDEIKNIWNHQLDMFNCNYTVFQHLSSLAPVREVTCTTSNTQRKTNWNCLYRFSIFRVAVKVSTHNLGFFGTCKFNTRFSPSIF